MSHLTRIETKLRDLEALRAALREMGFALGGPGRVRDTEGRSLAVEAQLESPGGIAGFARAPDGSLLLVTDWAISQRALGPPARFLGRLTQLYGVHKATIEALAQGYSVQREEGPNGVIRLALERAA